MATDESDTTSNINNQQTQPETKIDNIEDTDTTSVNQQIPPEKIKVDNIEEQKQSTNTQNVQVTSPHRSLLIRRIDEHLRIYYHQHKKKDYYDNDRKCGKFKIWCEENGYDTDGLIEEFNGDIKDACFTDFDDNFPFKSKNKDKIDDEKKDNIDDKDKKATKIFKYIKNLYEAKEEINVDEFNLYVSVLQMKETREIYQNHVKTWGSEDGFTQLTDINILYMLTLSRIYGNENLLLNVIDSCKRDIISQQIHIKKQNEDNPPDTDIINTPMAPENEKLEQWISKRVFLKELNKKMKTMANNWNKTELKTLDDRKTDNENNCILDLQMIVNTYPKRMGQRLSPMGCRLMTGDLEMVAKYIVASSKFLTQWITKETKGIGGPPFLFDFIILLDPSVSGDVFKKIDHRPASINDENKDNDDDDDDDDDPEWKGPPDTVKNEYKQDIIPNPISDLEACKCKYFSSIIEQEVKDAELFELVARKNMVDAVKGLRTKLKDTDKKIYPQNHRVNMIIDPRKQIDTDELIVFEPPKGSNKLSNVNIAECYFDLSRQCLIPRKGYIPWDERTTDDKIALANSDKEQAEKLKTQTIDSTQAAQGQILTFSYHVWASDEIKCYLLWNGRCHRFYPQDILELLPYLFEKSDGNLAFVKSPEAKRLVMEMEITDTKFEHFYRGLNRLHKDEFPKKYYVPHRTYPEFENNQTQ